MKTVGKIENLAENEEIKSARFMGKTGYFVTYENTDPLFSADLSDPENPKILGELKITGFSEYLHFYGENRLLGIGWETDPDTGSTEGLKCSMFDISDPSDVKEIDRIVLKNVSVCDALSNYRATLYHRAGIYLVLHMECIKTPLQEIIMIQINSIITDCFPTVRRRDLSRMHI